MEEIQQANAASNAALTTLDAQTRSPLPPCTGAGCRGDTSTLGKKSQYKPKNNDGYSTTSPAPHPTLPAPVGPWICYSLGAGQWRTPSGQGILSPRPQAYHTMSAPVYQSSSLTSTPASWDNSVLIAALNNLALQQGGWVMDSVASSHMSLDDGNIFSLAPLSSPHFITIGNGHTVPITSSGHSANTVGSHFQT
jgi:hypothetical protein